MIAKIARNTKMWGEARPREAEGGRRHSAMATGQTGRMVGAAPVGNATGVAGSG